MRLLQRFAVLLLLCAASFVQAELADAQRAAAKPFTGVLSRGFTASATWLELSIAGDPGARKGDTWILRVRPTYLDDLELHDPLDTSGRTRKGGDHVEWPDAEVKSLSHGFVIPASTEPRQIWLRLSTTSSSFIHVQVMTPEEFQYSRLLQEMVYGLMLGVLLLFFLWAVLHWVQWRETMMAMFSITQLMAIIYAMTLVGYNRVLFGDLLSAMTIDTVSNLIICGYVFVSFIFHYFFLREFQPARLLLSLIPTVAAVAFAAEVVLIGLGQVRPAMYTNILLVSLSPLLVLATAISCNAWQTAAEDAQPPITRRTLILFYLLVCSVLLVATSHALGLFDAPELNLHLYLIHGILTGAVLVTLLQVRALRNEASRNLAMLRARTSAQQVEIERQKSQLQSRFMEMLAHELKTSLSVLHMVFGIPQPTSDMMSHARRTLQSINDLIDRCLLVEKFEDDQIISNYEYFRVDEVVEESLRKSPDPARFAVYHEERITIKSDRQLLRSVVSNLLDNALKYSPPGSVVQLRVRQGMHEGLRGCELSVENEVALRAGVATFPDEEQLFKKYYRADSARRHSGSGLGLYLVANFVRLLGGAVRYERQEHSVRFIVWLPN
ncbi:MAG: ATP-binding protein [Burkholderiales bacterium]|nr:ATP-binding protein [Burkholderiales bacterium]